MIVCKREKVEIKCEICHKKFKTKWLLKRHMVIHKEKSRTICSKCSKDFKNKRYTQLHIQKSEYEVADDAFITSMVDYSTLVSNDIVNNKSNLGNVEELLAVVNPEVDSENNVELSVLDNFLNSCIA